MFNKMCIYW